MSEIVQLNHEHPGFDVFRLRNCYSIGVDLAVDELRVVAYHVEEEVGNGGEEVYTFKDVRPVKDARDLTPLTCAIEERDAFTLVRFAVLSEPTSVSRPGMILTDHHAFVLWDVDDGSELYSWAATVHFGTVPASECQRYGCDPEQALHLGGSPPVPVPVWHGFLSLSLGSLATS